MATVDADNRYYISNITALFIQRAVMFEITALCMKRKRDKCRVCRYIFFSHLRQLKETLGCDIIMH